MRCGQTLAVCPQTPERPNRCRSDGFANARVVAGGNVCSVGMWTTSSGAELRSSSRRAVVMRMPALSRCDAVSSCCRIYGRVRGHFPALWLSNSEGDIICCRYGMLAHEGISTDSAVFVLRAYVVMSVTWQGLRTTVRFGRRLHPLSLSRTGFAFGSTVVFMLMRQHTELEYKYILASGAAGGIIGGALTLFVLKSAPCPPPPPPPAPPRPQTLALCMRWQCPGPTGVSQGNDASPWEFFARARTVMRWWSTAQNAIPFCGPLPLPDASHVQWGDA